jgi:uracil-DNA glycosylase
MSTKILIIGQAPPYQKQKLPYDTTMLYDWLKEIGIDKERALERFEFDAVYNKFPGFGESGHKIPTQEQMDEYYPELKKKIDSVDKIWILGNVAYNYLISKNLDKEILFTIHPSRMNYNRFEKDKTKILTRIKNFING